MTVSQKIESRKDRWKRFYEGDSSIRGMYRIEIRDEYGTAPLPFPKNRDARSEWVFRKFETMSERIERIDDHTLPYIDMLTGTEVFAEAFGCPVQRDDDKMPFALPAVADAREAAALKVPRWEDTRLAEFIETADSLRERTGRDALMRLVDIQSPMDIAALIWEKADFYMTMADDPAAVVELAEKVRELLYSFLDEWFERYGREYIAHYPDYFMPRGMTLSEDEIGAVSEEMFQRFFLPELEELSRRYDGIGVHCCAHARHQWEGFTRIPDLMVLNLVQPPDITKEAYRFFETRTAQMHSWQGEGQPETWPGQYPENARVIMTVPARSEEEATRLADHFAEVYPPV